MEERIQEQKGVHMKVHALYQTSLPETYWSNYWETGEEGEDSDWK